MMHLRLACWMAPSKLPIISWDGAASCAVSNLLEGRPWKEATLPVVCNSRAEDTLVLVFSSCMY